MDLIKKLFYLTLSVAGLFLVAVNIIDLCSLHSNPDVYEQLYGFTYREGHWQFQSLANFQIWIFLQVAIYVFVFLASLLKIFKPAVINKIDYFYWGVILLLLLWFIRFYILWGQSGYDHYPGFDPYLL